MSSPAHLLDPGTSLGDAVDALTIAVEGLIDAVSTPSAVEGCDDATLLATLHRVEQVRNRLPVVDHPVIAEVERRQIPQQHCQGTTQRFLAGLLRLSAAEAGRRARAAEALSPRHSLTGELFPPVRATIAAAQHTGEVSPEQVQIILGALSRVDHRGYDPEQISSAEELLTDFAGQFAPPDLRRLADRVVEAVDPDGTVPDDQLTRDRRHLSFSQGPDGTWAGKFRLTPATGAKLSTILTSLAGDRSCRLDGDQPDSEATTITSTSTSSGSGSGENGPGGDVGGEPGPVLPDERSYPQRLHDALDEACDLLLRSDALPATGGTPATVIVTTDLENLRNDTGQAQLADGGTLPVRDLAHLAGQADLWTALCTATGVPLQMGRSRRIATPAQTLALITRDGGCSFPTCDRPPKWCERHHITGWAEGGQTDLDNLTLLCGYHHRHFLDRGWHVQLNRDRLPQWTPPAWIDPQRRPMINQRILAQVTAAGRARHRHTGDAGTQVAAVLPVLPSQQVPLVSTDHTPAPEVVVDDAWRPGPPVGDTHSALDPAAAHDPSTRSSRGPSRVRRHCSPPAAR